MQRAEFLGALLEELENSKSITLSAERLDVVTGLVRKAIADEEPATPTARKKQRKTARRVWGEYLALTGQGNGDLGFYTSRRVCGLPCAAHGTDHEDRDECDRLTVPLSPNDACTAIYNVWNGTLGGKFEKPAFASWNALRVDLWTYKKKFGGQDKYKMPNENGDPRGTLRQ
jgi:hypothetical protein